MAFFCPIFPKQNRAKAKEYEDSNYFSFDGGGRSLYSCRSMTALNFTANVDDDDEIIDRKSIDIYPSRLLIVNVDFEPTVDDELKVRRGDLVKPLYRDKEWVYVVRKSDSGDTQEGFVPFIYCEENENKLRRREQNKSQTSIFKAAFSRKSDRRNSEEQQSADIPKPASGNRRCIDVKSADQTHRIDRDRTPETDRSTKSIDNDQKSINSDRTTIDNGISSSDTDQTKRKFDNRINGKSPITTDHGSKSIIGPKALMNVDRFLRSLDENKNSPEEQPVANYAKIDKDKKIRYGAVTEFRKRPHGQLIAEYDFEAQNEDDVNVRKGDLLLLLNNDDPDWFWVRLEDGAEGFVPSNYVRKVAAAVAPKHHPHRSSLCSDGSRNFSELMITTDFEPEAADDLKVIKGDWIYSYQTPAILDSSWLWAYCPRTKRYGFVPKSIVRAPTATVL